MLRTSSYTIYVDLPGNDEEMLLVQTYTGAFDRVSRGVATYVRSLEVGRPPKPLYGDWTPEPSVGGEVRPPGEVTLARLQERGYLTTLSREEEEDFFKRFVAKLHAHYSRRWPSYLFMPTYDCNLRCSYCFQDHMRTDSRFRHLLQRMSDSMVDRIFAAFPAIEALHGIAPEVERQTDIGFFGGEPLLAENRPIVERIIRKAMERGKANVWAISNGTELSAYEDLLGPELLSSVQITLDGPPRQHDQRRIRADGSGSWDAIVRNIDLALERGVAVAVRTNVDRGNLPHLVELAEEVVRHGWHRHPNFQTQVTPVRAHNENTDVNSTLNTWELDCELVELRTLHPNTGVLGSVDDALRRQAQRVFTEKGLPSFKSSFCAAHTGMYIFDPFADIYACWEKTGDAKVRIGFVDENSQPHFHSDLETMWRSRTVASNPVCLKCRYNLFCGGGCAVLALGHRGNFYTNYCDGFGQRFRAAVAEAYEGFTTGSELAAGARSHCDL